MTAVPAGNNPQGKAGQEALHPRYEWRLQELMAVRKNWYSTTKLGPELRKFGFELDRSSIYRLVKTDRPPKMPVELILALCKILQCTFEDLVVEVEPEPDVEEPAPRGPRPVVPDMPLLSADFFDAEG
ncbi:helix-turn-helix domain-containing protein [Streptomyces chartreusis]|uniref:helix-turn-helix domain-containing protein n=1 Tax=Streptomyces chartreusis TaxID=1969 RepID=UPI0033A15007